MHDAAPPHRSISNACYYATLYEARACDRGKARHSQAKQNAPHRVTSLSGRGPGRIRPQRDCARQ